MLQTGTAWELLPQDLGCGSGMTCWRRLRDWQAARQVELMTGRAAPFAAMLAALPT